MSKNVTDRVLLKAIYDRYYPIFCSYDRNDPSRSSKIYVPIDIDAIAQELSLDGDIVFGRLYYHLEKKHGYKDDDGVESPLFAIKIGGEKHAVNFPLLSAVLAELEQSYTRFTASLVVSSIALVVSILALCIR